MPDRHLPWHEEIMSIADLSLDGMLVPVHEACMCPVACSEWVAVNMVVVAGGVTTRLSWRNSDIIDLGYLKLNLH